MGRKILAVFVGLVTDIVLSLILGLIFGAVIVTFLLTHGVQVHALNARVATLLQEPYIKLANAGLGCFGSLLGGFVTGWIARTRRVMCGAIMGVCSCAAGIPFMLTEPLWYIALGLALTLAMATAGAFVAEALFGHRQTQAAQ